jgi:hypothetical protein
MLREQINKLKYIIIAGQKNRNPCSQYLDTKKQAGNCGVVILSHSRSECDRCIVSLSLCFGYVFCDNHIYILIINYSDKQPCCFFYLITHTFAPSIYMQN